MLGVLWELCYVCPWAMKRVEHVSCVEGESQC